jgi:hypothetical protein
MQERSCHDPSRLLRRGDVVEIRGQGEIRASLDSDGKLEGLPFMPEMAKFCGRRFRVRGRVEKVYLDGRGYKARLPNTVLLEEVRCDGAAHGGCHVGCLLLWKEAWLKPANGVSSPTDKSRLPLLPAPTHAPDNGKFSCQPTELVGATKPLSWWQWRPHARDYFHRERSLGELLRMVVLTAWNKIRRRLGLPLHGKVCGTQTKTPAVCLDLQPGEMVRVKNREEIRSTLDHLGRNRGLVFVPDMVRFCGGTYRVVRRVEKGVLEWSGEMRPFRNTVALGDVTCSGVTLGCCGRQCYHLWREAWLERVSSNE